MRQYSCSTHRLHTLYTTHYTHDLLLSFLQDSLFSSSFCNSKLLRLSTGPGNCYLRLWESMLYQGVKLSKVSSQGLALLLSQCKQGSSCAKELAESCRFHLLGQGFQCIFGMGKWGNEGQERGVGISFDDAQGLSSPDFVFQGPVSRLLRFSPILCGFLNLAFSTEGQAFLFEESHQLNLPYAVVICPSEDKYTFFAVGLFNSIHLCLILGVWGGSSLSSQECRLLLLRVQGVVVSVARSVKIQRERLLRLDY